MLILESKTTNQPNKKIKQPQTLPIQERTMPYHQNSKISGVITPASQELVSPFCTASKSPPVISSVIPKDVGVITQLQFGCAVLGLGLQGEKVATET